MMKNLPSRDFIYTGTYIPVKGRGVAATLRVNAVSVAYGGNVRRELTDGLEVVESASSRGQPVTIRACTRTSAVANRRLRLVLASARNKTSRGPHHGTPSSENSRASHTDFREGLGRQTSSSGVSHAAGCHWQKRSSCPQNHKMTLAGFVTSPQIAESGETAGRLQLHTLDRNT